MKFNQLITLVTGVLLSAAPLAETKVLTNAKIYSFAWAEPSLEGTPSESAPFSDGRWSPDATTIVISDGLIEAVGDDSILAARSFTPDQIIDLNGAYVFPGFIDSHTHVSELGEVLSIINLAGLTTPEMVIDRLVGAAADVAAGEWIIGQGWDEGLWAVSYPTRFDLDAVFPDNPVVLKSLHGFGIWANSLAIDLAGIDALTQIPVGGEVLLLDDGSLSGIFLNNATNLMKLAIPQPTQAQFTAWTKTGLEAMRRDGFVAIHEAGADTRHLNAFQALRAKDDLPIRVFAMLSARDEPLAESYIKSGPMVSDDGWFDVRSVKAYYDGALGSRGARMLEDYSDMPGHRGVSGNGYGFNQELVTRLVGAGFQVGIHAIGDAGNRETIDYLQELSTLFEGSIELRHRIEHAQILSPLDIGRFQPLNVIASMEPQHAVEDKTWAEDRIGTERLAGAYAWRSLRERGAHLALNSDLPGSDHSIFYGLHSAVTRTDKNGLPEGGWLADEGLSIEEAIRGFTIWNAYAQFREQQTGTIEVGKWADLSIVDLDLMNIAQSDPQQLLNAQVIGTVVGGRILLSWY